MSYSGDVPTGSPPPAGAPNPYQQQQQHQGQEEWQHQNAKMVLSPEEENLLRDCNRIATWHRGVPAAAGAASGVYLSIKNGWLSGHPTRGAIPKCVGAAVISFFVGKISYSSVCANRFLSELPDSLLAQKIRLERGLTPREPQHQQQADPFAAPPTSPSAPQQPQQPPQSGGTTYDEMRRLNRLGRGPPAAFEPQQAPPPQQPQGRVFPRQPTEHFESADAPAAASDDAPPSKMRRRRVNQYGDEIFDE